MAIRVVLLLLTLAVASQAALPTNPIRLVSDGFHAPKSVSERKLNCLSWLLAVETENIFDWKVVPEACKYFVADFMTGNQYSDACEYVADLAIKYAQSTQQTIGVPTWVFDIVDTTLSSLDYHSQETSQFGALPFNSTSFHEWLLTEQATAVPGVLRLYDTLLSLKFRVVFLSGTSERFRDAIISNLKKVGFHTWDKIIFKSVADNRPTKQYKATERRKLVQSGHEIYGNIGDQWRDLEGGYDGFRIFKIPNPMYYSG